DRLLSRPEISTGLLVVYLVTQTDLYASYSLGDRVETEQIDGGIVVDRTADQRLHRLDEFLGAAFVTPAFQLGGVGDIGTRQLLLGGCLGPGVGGVEFVLAVPGDIDVRVPRQRDRYGLTGVIGDVQQDHRVRVQRLPVRAR